MSNRTCLFALVCLAPACGDAGADATEGASEPSGASSVPTTASSGPGTTAGPGSDTGDTETGSTSSDTGDSDTFKFDVDPDDDMSGGTTGEPACPGDEAPITFSYIWIANSPEGTVSKIDTWTGEELARYRTGPGNDDPSRTSVSLFGEVVVANRAGSITKIAARPDGCVDGDGDGVIKTSSGPGDVLAWGEDECVLWHVTLPGGGGDPPNTQGPRPVAWDTGPEMTTCVREDDRVWIGRYDKPSRVAHFYRLQGMTGEVLDEVTVPDWTSAAYNIGPYGGAIDQNNDLWVVGFGGPLVRIDGETLDWYGKYTTPHPSWPYGLALDVNGHPWLSGFHGFIFHFDPETTTFNDYFGQLPGDDLQAPYPLARSMRGLQVDRDGYAWIAANRPCGLIKVDTVNKTLVDDAIPLAGCDVPVGVSVDVDGFVWLPDQGANLAFKVDPVDLSISTTPGLNAPYTYSDMTGNGLGLVVFPPN